MPLASGLSVVKFVTVQLFINFLDGQSPGPLPPQARPAGAPNGEPELREWQAIEYIYRQDMFTGADYTGLLSPKFPLKSGLSFDQVVSYVQQNPGHDVYLFDAGPHYRYYSFNLFERVEDAMPGFKAKFTECLGQVGETVDFAALGRGLPNNTVIGNGWIGNAKFWREVVGDGVRLIETLRARRNVWRILCEPLIFNGQIYPFLPGLLELFVPYWLMTRDGISVNAYPYDKDYVLARCVRPLEKPLVAGFYELFNRWDEAGPWSSDKRQFIGDISRAFFRQLRSANDHMVYPWTGERIRPVK